MSWQPPDLNPSEIAVIVTVWVMLCLQSTMEEYEDMPIEEYGKAMLRGMGWKKGQSLGKTNKG